ncbi:DUF4238 domain-containing protein [Bacillus alkalisoli]|uniref:DUF4238 domain-containing protein n=1 Tax=Bacillus alkalisoli TaxID=2011008 RepID=UPI000C2331B3|nr:DUF4238 domain-containing protein [Bacillus alkalisoli]
MGKSIVKNQHYVPQRYLRKFAVAQKKINKNNYRFNIFDKEKQESRENQNVENYASERYFYDVDFHKLLEEAKAEGITIEDGIEDLTDKVDKQHLENVFATKVETTMFDPFENIITKYTLTPANMYTKVQVVPEEDKAIIAYYLAIQFVRTKEYREKIIQMYEKGTKLLLRKGLKNEIDSEFLESLEIKLKENRINLIHNEQLIDTELLESFAQVFLKHIWIFAVNETENLFYTSDNPLVFYGHKEHQGLGSKGVEIIFPITPKLALVMREVEHFQRDIPLYNRFIHIPKEYINFYNELQVIQSYKYIFSKGENLRLALELMEKHPELKDINRNRFLMG